MNQSREVIKNHFLVDALKNLEYNQGCHLVSFGHVVCSPTEWYEQLRNVVDPIRKEILETKKLANVDTTMLSMDLDKLSPKSIKLRILLSMLLENNPRVTNISKPILTMEQVAVMNTKMFYRPSREVAVAGNISKRHTEKDREQIPDYFSLKLYSIVRSKDLIQTLFTYGFGGFSYKGIIDFYDKLSITVQALYIRSGRRILPSNLRFGLTSVFVDDNIDKNSSSMTAKQHFHGTSVSVLQFPKSDRLGIERLRPIFSDLQPNEIILDLSVLDSYTNVLPSNLSVKRAHYPIQLINIPDKFENDLEQSFKDGISQEVEFLNVVGSQINELSTDNTSWVSHHVGKARDRSNYNKTIVGRLPLIDHVSNDIHLQAHIMKISIDSTKYLNVGQRKAIGCSDQPLYACKKKLQWANPDEFSKEDYFAFLGGLHIEQLLLAMNGDLVKGTGLDDIIKIAGLIYIGLGTAFTDVNHIKKSRYTVQVVLACLYKMLKIAHEHSGTSLDLTEWAESQCENSMFNYWYNIMLFQMNILLFVRSYRENNQMLNLSSMEKAVPLAFALDHYHYARWLPVFIQDLKLLSIEDPYLFKTIGENVSVTTTDAKFSKMAFDQKHEQMNKEIKSRSGYINLANKEDKTFLRKLELCSGEIHHYLENVECRKISSKHKEESPQFCKEYIKHCDQVFNLIKQNPFQATQFQKLNSSLIYPKEVEEDCRKIFTLGRTQYDAYVNTRFIFGSKDVVNTSIPHNYLKLPKDWESVAAYSPQIKVSLTNLTKLQEACDSRPDLAQKVFDYEFTRVPECFIDAKGKPFHSGKSKLFTKLIPGSESGPPTANGLIVDISTIIRSHAAIVNLSSLTYSDFAKYILNYVETLATKLQVERMDLVFDTYLNESIKSMTRDSRGQSCEILFDEDDLIKEKAESFLLNSENKTRFNALIQKHATNPLFWQWSGEIVTTYGKKFWSRNEGVREIGEWMDAVHEEADNRMLIHAKDMLDAGIKSIVIRTGDTDVIIIFLAYHLQFRQYSNSDIWIEKPGKKFISLNNAYDDLGESFCLAVPFFYCFCGCDSTTSFFQKPSTQMFDFWMKYSGQPELSEVFQQLSWQPSKEMIDRCLPIIEMFINFCYGQEGLTSVNEARLKIFKSSVSKNLRELPPCRSSLELHVQRSAYQSGWVWGNTLSQKPVPPVYDWGWYKVQDGRLGIRWCPIDTSLNNNDSILLDSIKTCRCKDICKNCNCARKNIACLKYCKCKGNCRKP